MKKILLLILFIPICVKAYSTSATSAILMDTDNNRILYSKNIHEIRSVASISKIMTAILAIESGKLDDIVKVNDVIDKSYGSGIYIKKNEELKLIDLVYGLMLRSGNDASLMIAEYVGGSIDNFVSMMNDKARMIGMKDTTFNNPNGLDEEKGNFSTAYDMAILTSYSMKNDIYKKIVSTKKYKLKTNMNTYLWTNKNKLLTSYKYTTGGKTGYTKLAKRTLVTTASKKHVNLVAVTLNDGNDFLDHKYLYEEAFKEYKNYKILRKGNIEIIGEKYYENVKYYIKKDFSYILNDNEKDTIILKFELEKKDNYKNNDKIGKVIVFIGDKKVYEEDVFIKVKKEKNKLFWWLND